MASVAEVKYREQFIAKFEANPGFLRPTVTSETIMQGGTLYFLTAGSGGRTAVGRGSNGLIPVADDSQTQTAVTLAASYDKQVRNGFDIFAAQSNQLEIIRNNGVMVLNRKIDDVIIVAIAAGSVTLGSVGTMSKTVANRIVTIMRNANVGDTDNEIYILLSPAAWAYLTDITSFANTLYSSTGGNTQEGIPQQGRWKFWMGANWAEHPGLTGIGTSSTCLAYHKRAIGHAIGPQGVSAEIGPVAGEDQSYVLHKVYHGAALLQNAGVVKFTHDDSGLSS